MMIDLVYINNRGMIKSANAKNPELVKKKSAKPNTTIRVTLLAAPFLVPHHALVSIVHH